MVFTIDPADARDFDDALSLEPAEDFRKHGAVWRLGVHIADVSHYVEWNSSLDLDARRRATSVYLVDRVIPMLPEQLSNGLCSLNPGETRRCMTCDVYLDEDWRPVGYDLYPALMRSCARLDIRPGASTRCRARRSAPPARSSGLKGCAPGQGIDDAIMQRVESLSEFARARIALSGKLPAALTSSSPRPAWSSTGPGKPCGVDLRVKNQATSLVEEAMILANEVVAAHLHERDFPALYRVHEKPSPDSLAALAPRALGVQLVRPHQP